MKFQHFEGLININVMIDNDLKWEVINTKRLFNTCLERLLLEELVLTLLPFDCDLLFLIFALFCILFPALRSRP
jgi:hypothetical protein